MKIAGMLLAAALLVPVALSAQQQPGQAPRGRMMMRNAAAIAIEHKADLGLSDEIVGKLQAIDKQVQDKNAPLVQKMRDAMQGGGFQNMTDEQRQQMQTVRQQLRDNNQAARADVEKLLTPEQVQKLGDLIQQEMPQRGPRPNG